MIFLHFLENNIDDIWDRFFIFVLCGIYSLFTVIRIYYRYFAQKNTSKIEISEKKRSINALNVLIIFELSTFCIFVIWFILDSNNVPFSFDIPISIQYFGVILGFLADFYFWYIHHSLGSNFSPNLKIREHQQLVTWGAYRRIRHPMYTAFLMLHISVFLISENWFLGITWNLGVLLLIRYRIPREELLMLQKFGTQYENYIKETGQLIPPIFTHRSKINSTESTLKIPEVTKKTKKK